MGVSLTYFITALVITVNTVPSGWLQYTHSYEDKKACEALVETSKDSILLSISKHLGSKFVRVEKVECITYEEAVERNTALGH